MFDIGWSELAVIAVVALIVIGPRDLPRILYTAGKMAGKARAMLRELQQGIEDMGREAELEEMRKKIEATRDFDLGKQMRNTIDPRGEIEAAFDTDTHRGVTPPPEQDASGRTAPADTAAPANAISADTAISAPTEPPAPPPAQDGAPPAGRA